MRTLASRRIIGLGNRLVEHDAAGPAVCDALSRGAVPAGVAVVDGGLAGLNLLPYFDGAEQVVLVDALLDPALAPGVYQLDPADLEVPSAAYGHGAGLAYLLRALPFALEGTKPEIVILGVAGGTDPGIIARAVEACLRLVATGANSATRPWGVVR